jgi:colanic acid/amylovoran biosynthesis protein
MWLRSIGVDPQAGRPFLGVTVMNWGAQNRSFAGQPVYERAVAAAVRHFVESTHGRAFLLPQCWGPSSIEDDRIPARRVAKLLAALGDSVTLVEHPLPAGRLKSVFGQMDIFLGTRMHSNIFSLSQNVPLVAIQYNHKTAGIARMAGIEQWVLDINHLDDQVLIEKLDYLWSERQQVRQALSLTIPELVAQARQPGALLASDYASLVAGDR